MLLVFVLLRAYFLGSNCAYIHIFIMLVAFFASKEGDKKQNENVITVSNILEVDYNCFNI